MNAALAILFLLTGSAIALFIPDKGGAALIFCIMVALVFGYLIGKVESDRRYLLQLFVAGLLIRMMVGSFIFAFELQEFFGGDAITYDHLGFELLQWYRGLAEISTTDDTVVWGMPYLVAGIYAIVGRNVLAVQFFNAICGAAAAVVVYVCAQHIFQNVRVARVAALLVAFYPSLILWSSQALKDAPIVLLLAVAIMATLKLGEQLSVRYGLLLSGALLGLLSLRFYIFYMVAAAITGAFVIGMKRVTAQNFGRQFVVIAALGLMLTYVGVLRTASAQLGAYGNLETMQRSRQDLATAQSAFGQDVDVSTTSGALSVIPLGMMYLLFAPFPWQMANLRQSITLPEMMLWWGSFPLLVLGGWFTLKYRLRQALPIILFTTMLTLAYSIFQGNVGTAYRQRSQLLIFYFIFVAVGFVLLKERREERARQAILSRQAAQQLAEGNRRYRKWKQGKEKELEDIANSLSEKIGF
ncbi:MAG TPA: glycosyltransferase family 39 protein [Pyrinomonadaceae bacterium]|nr:glycosyltransferase family 39 protein [Pyrinomonadaceae bacterium]